MSKRQIICAMSREKKRFEKSVEYFEEFNQRRAESTATKRAATNDGDPLSLKRTVTPELLVEMHKVHNDTTMENAAGFEDVITLLKRILDKQDRLEARIIKLETTITELATATEQNKRNKAEDMARDKVMLECKVLANKVHKSICRLTGEQEDEIQVDIAASLPITTLEAAQDMDEKIRDTEYKEAMKLYVLKKNATGTKFDNVLRNLYTDEFLWDFNWEGKSGKHALMQYYLASELLYECFNFPDRGEFETSMKQFISRSHNRRKHYRRYERSKIEESESRTPEASTPEASAITTTTTTIIPEVPLS